MIISGLNVYPAEVENLIYSFPNMQETVVFAIPDPKRDQVIGAAVVPRQGHVIAAKELLILCAAIWEFQSAANDRDRESLPRTSLGKVIRDPDTLLSN